MSGLYVTASSGELASQTAAKTLVMAKAPADHKLRLTGFKVSFKGTDPSQLPIKSQLVIGYSDEDGLSVSAAVRQNPGDAETPQSGVYVNVNTATDEPAGGSAIMSDETPPAGGVWEKHWARGDGLIIPAGTRIGLRVTAGTSTTAIAELYLEE